MNKKVILGIALAIGLLVALLAVSVRRVPSDRQLIRIEGGTATASYRPGTHLIWPGSRDLIEYPLGVVELRCPEQGDFSAMTADNVDFRVAVSLRLEFTGGGEQLYQHFGRDYVGGIRRTVEDILLIEAASWTAPHVRTGQQKFGQAVSSAVGRELSWPGLKPLGIRFDSYDIGGGQAAAVDVKVADEPIRRVVLVGVDGADWDVIGELTRAGRLPNFARLVSDGTTGSLQSIEPLLSPLLWTTMATGKLPEEHGILNFTVADPETGKRVPISRVYRQVDAVWNMLSDHDRTVSIVGWLATFPAEAINGVMITDRVGYLAYADAAKDGRPIEGSVYPPARADEIAGLVRKSSAIQYEEFAPFITIDRQTFERNRSLAFDPKNPVNDMIMLYASTESYRRMALHLLDQDAPDLLAVYFELVDATKHLFMHYAPPAMPDVDPAKYDRYKNAVSQAYVYQDQILGEIMGRCDDNTVLVVVSDHGFKSGDKRPKQRPEIWAGGAAFWHRLEGIICMWGNGIRRGHRLEGASILDVAPTLLALQGFPKAADMPGKVLTDAFEASVTSALSGDVVATLQGRRDEEPVELTGDAATDEALKKLEALGYITPDNPDAHNNLGQRLQSERRYAEAVAEFKKALELNPNFPAALNNLGVCYGKMSQFQDAQAAFERALGLNPEDVYAMNNMAIMFMQTGRLEEAVAWAEKSVAVEPNYANGHLTLGSIYANMGRLERAEEEFQMVLQIDPSNQNAQANLQRLRSARNK